MLIEGIVVKFLLGLSSFPNASLVIPVKVTVPTKERFPAERFGGTVCRSDYYAPISIHHFDVAILNGECE